MRPGDDAFGLLVEYGNDDTSDSREDKDKTALDDRLQVEREDADAEQIDEVDTRYSPEGAGDKHE